MSISEKAGDGIVIIFLAVLGFLLVQASMVVAKVSGKVGELITAGGQVLENNKELITDTKEGVIYVGSAAAATAIVGAAVVTLPFSLAMLLGGVGLVTIVPPALANVTKIRPRNNGTVETAKVLGSFGIKIINNDYIENEINKIFKEAEEFLKGQKLLIGNKLLTRYKNEEEFETYEKKYFKQTADIANDR